VGNRKGIFPIGGIILIAIAVYLAGVYTKHKALRDEQYELAMDDTTHVMKLARK